MLVNRRNFLSSAASCAIGMGAFGGIGSTLRTFSSAQAADISGYRALVCVFLLGGMDCHDTLLPYDTTSYSRYADIRAPLLGLYDQQSGGSTRVRSRLLELNPTNGAAFGTRRFALTEEMSGIHNLFEAGNAAIVANVGPLIEPVSRTQFQEQSRRVPTRLFSHNDQQSTWVSNSPEGAQFGWGGRFADAALGSGANPTREFSTITTLGNELFLTGEQASPYQIGLEGGTVVNLLEFLDGQRSTPGGEERYQLVREQLSAGRFTGSNLLQRDMASASSAALVTNELYNTALDTALPLATTFPTSFLGQQLSAVARAVSVRDTLLASRQVFFVGVGGYDTHSNQATNLPSLQQELNDGVVAFFSAMQELGVENNVTLFTASDFGRTLAINGDGTDHGWGGHHFVVGGAVQGQQIYGNPPPYDFDHDLDGGNGRLIPALSVDQYASPLGRWFGLTDSEIQTALPNLANFSGAPLDFI